MTPLGWVAIFRLGLVQAALGAVVVLVTATLNRVMVVELALPAAVPGALIALHYGVQLLRPRWGHGSDGTGRRTPWIVGGMAVLSGSGVAAAAATAAIPAHPALGLAAAALAFVGVGLGVGAAGTSTLVLAATRVAAERRPVAAPVLWVMMIAGFAVTAGVVGACLDPFSLERLVRVVAAACGLAFVLACLAVWGLEGAGRQPVPAIAAEPRFRQALRQTWAEPAMRRFTLFVFLSMLATSAQDVVLEPFAGVVLHLSPGGTARLSGLQHGGALAGMVAVGLVGALLGPRRPALMGGLAVAGCLLSALVLGALGLAGFGGVAEGPLRPAVALLGFGNGVFAVAAVGAMMALAVGGRSQGLRMGVWGAAQAAAFGLGSLVGPALVDGLRWTGAAASGAYGAVFLIEALLFVVAAYLARGSVAAPESDMAGALAARAA